MRDQSFNDEIHFNDQNLVFHTWGLICSYILPIEFVGTHHWSPIPRIMFFAWGLLKFGVHVRCIALRTIEYRDKGRERESQGASKLLKGAKTYKSLLHNRQARPTIIMVTIGRHLVKKSWVPNWTMMVLFLLKIFDSITWTYGLFNIVWDHLLLVQTEKSLMYTHTWLYVSSWHHVLALDLNKIK
jgi:hypothetical protein